MYKTAVSDEKVAISIHGYTHWYAQRGGRRWTVETGRVAGVAIEARKEWIEKVESACKAGWLFRACNKT